MVTAQMGQWSGNRLICVGDYAYGVPKRMELSEAERADLKRCGKNLYNLAHSYSASHLDGIKWPWISLKHDLLERGTSENDWRYVDQLVKAPRLRSLVLRNLSTHEYVRGDALAAFNGERKGQLPERRRRYYVPETLANVLVTLV
jgi:hypothetical protein